MEREKKTDRGTDGAGPGLLIVATAAAAVGLGGLWQLPFAAVQFGGATFLVLFLGCLLLIGTPFLMAGLLLGRQGGSSVVHALHHGAGQSKASRRWALVGYLALFSGLLLLVACAVPASWALRATWVGVQGLWSAPESGGLGGMIIPAASEWRAVLLALFLVPVAAVLAVGAKALRVALWVLAPVFFLLLLAALGYRVSETGFMGELALALRWQVPDPATVLRALELAILTLGLGVSGAIACGGGLAPQRRRTSFSLAVPAVMVALLSALAALIMLLVLSVPLSPDAAGVLTGPAKRFVTLPTLMAEGRGTPVLALLYASVVVGGWCGGLMLAESLVAWLEQSGLRRSLAAPVVVLVAWLLGLGGIVLVADGIVFAGTLGFLVVHVLLPLAVLLVAVFAGWVMKETRVRKALAMQRFILYLAWRAALRILVPLAMLALLAATVLGWS